MTQPNWQRVQEIFDSALMLPVSERGEYVKRASAGDAEVETKVLALLAAHDSTGDILQSPIFEFSTETSAEPDQARRPELNKLLGTIVGEQYLIGEMLGEGGMGEVYLARNQKLDGRLVVLKILSEDLIGDSHARERFKKEAEALSRIHHTGVVGVLDKGELPDGRPFIAMQYVDGETLRSQIKPEGMPLERAASILMQIGDALEHVHENGIFHRDLKPENIMLKRGTDSVVLVDFGIAKVKNSLVAPSTAEGPSAGTLLYMSPEQLRDETITSASDVYSMALIAYEMVTGRRPFNAASLAQLLELQRKGAQAKPVALRPNLSSEAERVILRGMSFDLKRRYRSAGEFGHHLERALKGEKAPDRSIKKLAAVMTLILITSLLFTALFFYSKRDGAETASNRAFTYWLMVQRTRDGQDYKEPIKSNGDETFERDDRFQLNVLSPASGYIYVIREEAPDSSDTTFTMLYPREATNKGAATIGADQTIQFDWITFRGPAGSENFWLVWSGSPVSQLEAVKKEAFDHKSGALTGNSLVSVKEFFRTQQSTVKVKVYHYNANQNAVVRGPSEILITLAKFKHR